MLTLIGKIQLQMQADDLYSKMLAYSPLILFLAEQLKLSNSINILILNYSNKLFQPNYTANQK